MTKTLVIAVKSGSCLNNITTLWNDALINDTLNITQPSAQLTKVYTILTVVKSWLLFQNMLGILWSDHYIWRGPYAGNPGIIRKEPCQRFYPSLQSVTPRSQITTFVLQNLRKASLSQKSRISYNKAPDTHMFVSFCSSNWRARLLK